MGKLSRTRCDKCLFNFCFEVNLFILSEVENGYLSSRDMLNL
jgi:hypothetical protein